MGSTLIERCHIMGLQLTNRQAHQDGAAGEECSFGSSSMSNLKDSSLNEIDEFMYMLEEGATNECQYQSLLKQPPVNIASTSLNTFMGTNHYLIENEEAPSSIAKGTNPLSNHNLIEIEEAHSCITKGTNPLLAIQALPYSPNSHHIRAKSCLAPLSFMKNIKQPYYQNLHIENAQAPLHSDNALLYHSPSSPSLFDSTAVSNDCSSQCLIDNYIGAKDAEEPHDVECFTYPSNEALEQTSSEPYNMPNLAYTFCTTSPTLLSIVSPSLSPTSNSLAVQTSTLLDRALVDATSFPPTHCQESYFIDGGEMMPSLMTLHTRSSMNGTSKSKNVKIQKVTIKKKRKRTRTRKNAKELESQRMTHIAVERNRRRQMNQHLNDLRSLMPSSYIQRGDQASIVGGAIRLVEELEKVLESLYLQKQMEGSAFDPQVPLSNFDDDKNVQASKESHVFLQSSMVNVQVEMVSWSSILVKVITPKRHHQLLQALQDFSFLSLKVIQLNVTSLDICNLYSFSLKMENGCQFQTAFELAKSIQHIFQTHNVESQ